MHNGLDKYLQAIAHELRKLEPEQRESELREIRAHLEAMIVRLMEGGLSADEATEAAIAQFGSARKVGRGLMRARLKHESIGRVVAAPLCGMLGQLVLMGATLGAIVLLDRLLGLEGERSLLRYKSGSMVAFGFGVCVSLTTIAGGVISGRMAPRSAPWSVPLLSVALGVASSAAFPFEVTLLALLKNALLVFAGACIGSRLGSRRAERA